MIGMRTILEVADNRGARRLACILPRGGDLGLRAGLGDVVTASVKEAAPDSAIKKGKVVRCVIVRMRKETRRKDGTYIGFDTNAAVLINEWASRSERAFSGRWPGTARQEVHEDCVAGARGNLMAIAKRKPAEPVRIEIKKEDTVKVISGRDKGREGACPRGEPRDRPDAGGARDDDQTSHAAQPAEADQGRHRGAKRESTWKE